MSRINHGNVTMACVADIFPSEIMNDQTNISHDQIDNIYFLHIPDLTKNNVLVHDIPGKKRRHFCNKSQN